MEESCNSPFILLTKKKHLKAAIHWACVQFPRPQLTSYSPNYTCCEWLIYKIDTISTNFINLWLSPWRSCSAAKYIGHCHNKSLSILSREGGRAVKNGRRGVTRQKRRTGKSSSRWSFWFGAIESQMSVSWKKKQNIWAQWRPHSLPKYTCHTSLGV